MQRSMKKRQVRAYWVAVVGCQLLLKRGVEVEVKNVMGMGSIWAGGWFMWSMLFIICCFFRDGVAVLLVRVVDEQIDEVEPLRGYDMLFECFYSNNGCKVWREVKRRMKNRLDDTDGC